MAETPRDANDNLIRFNTDWISMKDRQPEPYQWVLVCCLNGLLAFARLETWEQGEGDDYPGQIDLLWRVPCCDASHLEMIYNPVTHWMPAPTLPPGRQEGEGTENRRRSNSACGAPLTPPSEGVKRRAARGQATSSPASTSPASLADRPGCPPCRC